ncbi:MAG: NAD(P)-binding domain-containing protein [Myxococcales bacterium]|nr:NAD(P)-binding domain-containing protein [Myxococcales bacterium]
MTQQSATSPLARLWRLPRVCIIGAGSSGIAAAKALYERGIPFDCFERGDRVGGNWVFQNSNGVSAAYRSLHINTSRDRMQYRDYAMPSDYPDFPHHSLIARYFEDYVDHFGFRQHITFATTVERCARGADGVYQVDIASASGVRETRRYDALMVCNGHHWDPRWPDPPFEGTLDGDEIHSHSYIDPDEPLALRGKNVVVVGMGNSAMDIACELGRADGAARVFLSARRGAYVLPNYLLGRPLDQLGALPTWVDIRARVALLRTIYRFTVGRVEDYGLPRPDHRIEQAHPTISSELLPLLEKGRITPKPNIERLDGPRVSFVDGSSELVDAAIYCTGYNVTFPFFEDTFISAPDNELPLFRRVFKPGLADVFFIGLCQPLGAVMPIAEAQSKWIADYLLGEYALPRLDEMQRDIDEERDAMARRYVTSSRHTMQVDFDDYLAALDKERERGAQRAAQQDGALPVRALA